MYKMRFTKQQQQHQQELLNHPQSKLVPKHGKVLKKKEYFTIVPGYFLCLCAYEGIHELRTMWQTMEYHKI